MKDTKRQVSVLVIGETKTGSTTIMKSIVDHLTSQGADVSPHWDEKDGPPPPIPMAMLAERVKRLKSQVVISEHRPVFTDRHESLQDFQVKTYHREGVGYFCSIVVLGVPLFANFGDLPISKEKAKTLAARLAAELGVDVQDEIPRDYEVSQSSGFNPLSGI